MILSKPAKEMNKMKKFVLIMLAVAGVSILSVAAFAAETKPEPQKTAPVSAEVRAAYWRAVSDLRAANDSVRVAQERMKAAVEAMTKECKGNPVPDQATGEPQCAVTPPEKGK